MAAALALLPKERPEHRILFECFDQRLIAGPAPSMQLKRSFVQIEFGAVAGHPPSLDHVIDQANRVFDRVPCLDRGKFLFVRITVWVH